MNKRTYFSIFIFLILITLISDQANAHQSGCHAWHSCPSDSGSYTCGDTGHCTQCPNNLYCLNGKLKTNITINPRQLPQNYSNHSTTIAQINKSNFTQPELVSQEQKNVTQNNTTQQQIEALNREIQQVKTEQEKQKNLIEQIMDELKNLFPIFK